MIPTNISNCKNLEYLKFDNTKIKIEYDRLEDLKKMDAKRVIGGRTVEEIIQRFEKKIKDPSVIQIVDIKAPIIGL